MHHIRMSAPWLGALTLDLTWFGAIMLFSGIILIGIAIWRATRG
jgi:hypothetical protein